MGWTKDDAAYKPVRTTDDIEFAVLADLNGLDKPNEVQFDVQDVDASSPSPPPAIAPQRHLARKNYNRLVHYAISSVLLLVALVLQINYLVYKFYLYSGYVEDVLHQPYIAVLLFCECAYLASTLFGLVDHLMPPSSRADLGLMDTSGGNTPTVDIFIPCCKEPTEVPMEATLAALALDYPQHLFKVFVLDDGGDDELRAFCEALKVESGGARVEYIRRAKPAGVPHNFKCGNMNNGLKSSEAEFVVIMDADMILHPTYLRRVMPHIVASQDVAFVQVPQAFYNLPIGDPLNDSGILAYAKILVNRDSIGTGACVGTGALFRRKHLNEVGGFQPESITEDTMTAFILWNKGYESVYLDEKLQIGLTPWTFEGYVKQRQRWGKGAVQQWVASWRACLGRKSQLNFVQKLLYIHHTGYYFLSFVNVLLLGTLFGALAFNWTLSIGNYAENVVLIKNLALYLVAARVSTMSVWLNVPQGLMMRNREESHFWWMTPYFLQFIVDSLRDFKASFVFVPTSNIDKGAAAAKKSETGLFASWLTEYTSQLSLVKFHLAFVVVVIPVVIWRASHAYFVTKDCSEQFLVVGLSLFIVCTAAHMLVPVLFIFFPPSFKPSQRKSLIRFNAEGVPQFTPEDCVPKWSSTVIPYEVLSWATLIFWIAALVVALRNPSGNSLQNWCKAYHVVYFQVQN